MYKVNTMAQFSLSWSSYKQNICNGLCTLQQNGEFVDMTLAADGHHVKVHQLVMSLVSPYIKELISSAQCPHPVIFLNKVSYPVLCSILEYVYTGEVLVTRDDLPELIEAARQLQIKGLEDTQLELSTSAHGHQSNNHTDEHNASSPVASPGRDYSPAGSPVYLDEHDSGSLTQMDKEEEKSFEMLEEDRRVSVKRSIKNSKMRIKRSGNISSNGDENATGLSSSNTRVQYSISNQGVLQIILNRYLYHWRYTSRRGPGGRAGHRAWRCADYNKSRCPATLVTKDDVVIKRYGVHNHPFHDKQILKRVSNNCVFAAIKEAEIQAATVKGNKPVKN